MSWVLTCTPFDYLSARCDEAYKYIPLDCRIRHWRFEHQDSTYFKIKNPETTSPLPFQCLDSCCPRPRRTRTPPTHRQIHTSRFNLPVFGHPTF